MYYQKTMEAENQALRSQFLVRLSSLPVLHTAWNQATSAYDRVKQANSLIDYTLSTMEKSVLYANEKAQPLVKKFEQQVNVADMLACKGLDKLEQTVPIIKEPTEKIIQDTKELYSNTVKSGLDRYNGLRSYGIEKVNAVKEYGTKRTSDLLNSEYSKLLTSSVDGALSLTENCINLYLPASDDEEKENVKEKPVLQRMSYLSTVVHRRARKLATLKLQELQQTAGTTIQNMDLNGRLGQLRTVPENMYTNTLWFLGELNKEPQPIPEGTTPSLQQLALINAQNLTHGLVSTYNTTVLTVQKIPSQITSSLTSAYAYSFEVYSSVQKTPAKELPQQLVSQARVILRVDERVAAVTHLLNNLPAFQWLIVTAYDENSANEDLFAEDEIFDRANYMNRANH